MPTKVCQCKFIIICESHRPPKNGSYKHCQVKMKCNQCGSEISTINSSGSNLGPSKHYRQHPNINFKMAVEKSSPAIKRPIDQPSISNAIKN